MVECDLADPRLQLVTFTGVRMSPDLRVAWIHYSCMPTAQREACEHALEHAAGMLKREVGRRLRLRYVPDLRFRYDDSLERSERISRLLDEPGGED